MPGWDASMPVAASSLHPQTWPGRRKTPLPAAPASATAPLPQGPLLPTQGLLRVQDALRWQRPRPGSCRRPRRSRAAARRAGGANAPCGHRATRAPGAAATCGPCTQVGTTQGVCVCGGGTGTRRAPCMHAAAAQGFGVEHRACMQQRRRAGSCARPIQQQLLVSGGVGGGAGKGWRAQPGPDKGRREGPFVSGPGGAAPGADKGGYGVGARGWVYVCVGGVIKLALIALVWARFIDQARSGSPRREGGAVHGGCIPTGGGGVHPRESAHGGGVSVHGGGGGGGVCSVPPRCSLGKRKASQPLLGFFFFVLFFGFFFPVRNHFQVLPDHQQPNNMPAPTHRAAGTRHTVTPMLGFASRCRSALLPCAGLIHNVIYQAGMPFLDGEGSNRDVFSTFPRARG